jgi:hypothetical protein
MRDFLPVLTVTSILWIAPGWTQNEGLAPAEQLKQKETLEETLQFYSTLFQEYPHDIRVLNAFKRV